MVSKSIRQQISDFESGKVFALEDFSLTKGEQKAAVMTLGRLVQQGVIDRLSPGNYYKPKVSPFGKVGPTLEERFRDLLYEKGNPVGYLTGLYAFNLLGLTTQQPTVLEIGTNFPKRSLKRGMYAIRFVLQRNPVTARNIEFLRVLDCLKWIKKIPDTSVDRSYQLLKAIVQSYGTKEQAQLVKLSLNYSPLTRALLGSMLVDETLSEQLSETLSPLTRFNIGLSSTLISQQWNIQ